MPSASSSSLYRKKRKANAVPLTASERLQQEMAREQARVKAPRVAIYRPGHAPVRPGMQQQQQQQQEKEEELAPSSSLVVRRKAGFKFKSQIVLPKASSSSSGSTPLQSTSTTQKQKKQSLNVSQLAALTVPKSLDGGDSDSSSSSDDEAAARRRRMASAQVDDEDEEETGSTHPAYFGQQQQQPKKLGSDSESGSWETDTGSSSSGSSGSSSSSSEEEDEPMPTAKLARPVYVSKKQRATLAAAAARERAAEAHAETQVQRKIERKKQALKMVVDTIVQEENKTKAAQNVDELDQTLPDDDDEVAQEACQQVTDWYARETKRISEAKLALEKVTFDSDSDAASAEEPEEWKRRRNMTDRELLRDNFRLGKLTAEEERARARALAEEDEQRTGAGGAGKYFHKGAFFVEDVLEADKYKRRNFRAQTTIEQEEARHAKRHSQHQRK